MRSLNFDIVNIFLAPLGLKIGAWGQVCNIVDIPFSTSEWVNYPAPNDGIALYCFSQQILHWLTPEAEKLLQIDNSTFLNEDEEFLISRLLFGSQGKESLNNARSFLFMEGDINAKQEQWLLNAVIYLLLLFGHHCQIVSKAGKGGQHISIQDGYVYFLSKTPADLERARKMMSEFEKAPLKTVRLK